MRVIGIDFGTCNIKGAERKKNGDIVPVKLGKNIDEPRIPNVIIYEKRENGYSTIIGNTALKKYVPEQNRVRNIKSSLQESSWSRTLDFGKTVNAYDVTLDIMKNLYIEIYENNKNLGVSATVTVPVNFSKRQQSVVEKAAKEAGFVVNSIVSEPFAALFFLMQDNIEDNEEHNVLIFDFGGGTLDLCLAEISNTSKGRKIETQSAVGITYGGNDINKDILENILQKKESDKVKSAIEEPESKFEKLFNRYAIMKAIDELKATFFSEDEVDEDDEEDVIPKLFGEVPVDFGTISVKEIYDMLDDKKWDKRIVKLLDRLFDDSDLLVSEVTDIFMVGGSSSIPYFKNVINEYFKQNGHNDIESLFELNDDIDIEDRIYSSVSSGAVIYNELMEDDNFIIKEKIPFMVYTKNENNQKCTKLTRSDYYKDYYSSMSTLTSSMKENKKISIYQTVFGEEDKEVYLGDVILNDEIVSCATLYRLMVNKDRNIQVELGYLLKDEESAGEEDLFCVDWRLELEI